AYGVGTTVSLGSDDYVTQYYAPYLSGIQLYTKKPFSASRSSGCHDNGSLEVEKISTDGDTSSHNSGKPPHDNVSSGSSRIEDRLGSPYLIFIESCSPNYRVPLWKKSLICDPSDPLHPLQNESRIDYFTLADLWSCNEESSAYGTGTMVSIGAMTTLLSITPLTSLVSNSIPTSPSLLSGLVVAMTTARWRVRRTQLIETLATIILVAELATENLGLMTLTSVDLSHASRMSVAW
ncbi:hypothetical protein LINGRAHAP2_LOCUS14578, partial [Linum grandiflorum]